MKTNDTFLCLLWYWKTDTMQMIDRWFLSQHILDTVDDTQIEEQTVCICLRSIYRSNDCQEYFKEKIYKLRSGYLKTKAGNIEILTPVISMRKSEIVLKGKELNVPFALSWSCYKSSAKACGQCDSCALRIRGFKEAGIADPIDYQQVWFTLIEFL